MEPEKIHWCDGSEEEKKVLIAEMLKTGDLLELNEKTHPNCFYTDQTLMMWQEWNSLHSFVVDWRMMLVQIITG